MTIDYLPASEALGHTAPLAYRATYPVLGVPVCFQSNSAAVIERVTESFGQWADLEPEWVRNSPPCDARFIVHPVDGADGSIHPLRYTVHGALLMASNREIQFCGDWDSGRGIAFVPPEAVGNSLHFRYNVIESLAFHLVSLHERVPVHAGALVYQGQTILLLGKSTVGKSTLCYAAVRSGDFDLLAEDIVCVQTRPVPRLFGGMGRLHLLPDAPRLFPELAEFTPQLQANGKFKIGVPIPPARVRLHGLPGALCFLSREAGQREATLEPMSREEAIARLVDPREPGYDLFLEQLPPVADMLTSCPAYRFTIGTDLESALTVLKDVIAHPVTEASRP